MLVISAPYSNALMGRFAAGCPSMEVIRKFTVPLGLKGDCPVGLLDSRHILLHPLFTEDLRGFGTEAHGILTICQCLSLD